MRKIILFIFLILSMISSAQKQIWKAIGTNDSCFTSSRDGQKIAWLRNEGVAYAVGGWLSNVILYNEVYTTNDKGITWDRKANAPWGEAHDFLFASSVTGDTLVKWGGRRGGGFTQKYLYVYHYRRLAIAAF